MKGREAVRAANRRTAEAVAEAERLRTELAQERAERKEEATALRAEVKRLKANHMAEASRLAAEEVVRRIAQVEEEQRASGFSYAMAKNAMYAKDKFVLNACKYVSMTTGKRPLGALNLVMTWMTSEDFSGFGKADLVVKLGLPSDGWVAGFLRMHKHDLKRIARNYARNGEVAAVSLERAEREGHPDIHPDYNPRWYPDITYELMQLADDEDAPAAQPA